MIRPGMVAVPARPSPEREDEGGSLPSSLLGLARPAPAEVEEPLPPEIEEWGPTLFLLGHQISPQPRSLRDWVIYAAVLLSLLLHVVVFVLLPAGEKLILAYEEAHRPKVDDDVPPVYLLPYLPQQRVETPSRPKAPLSDLSRRAHGGEGQPDVDPGSRGNTPEPRIVPPGSPAAGAPEEKARQAAGERAADAAAAAPGEGAEPLGGSGEGAVLRVPRRQGAGKEASEPVLKGLSSMGLPGSAAGEYPDRKGGMVDLGPLSFDTEWYEWGPYAREMLRRIRYHWVIPEIAMLGVRGVVRIRFFIERDGAVTGVVIDQVSGHPSMDFAARDAIVNASPLPPLPGDLTGVDREGVTITFFYNERRESGEGG